MFSIFPIATGTTCITSYMSKSPKLRVLGAPSYSFILEASSSKRKLSQYNCCMSQPLSNLSEYPQAACRPYVVYVESYDVHPGTKLSKITPISDT